MTDFEEASFVMSLLALAGIAVPAIIVCIIRCIIIWCIISIIPSMFMAGVWAVAPAAASG